MSSRGAILLAGALAQKAGQGGMTWVYLQYLLGLRKLGWDVLFVDWLDRPTCADPAGSPRPVRRSANVEYSVRALEAFGLGDSYAILDRDSGESIGMPRAQVLETARRCACLVNVMGYLDDEEILAAVPLRVFLDIDPGFGQMWWELGLHDPYPAHDRHVTVGESIGTEGCRVPACGVEWITTPQPVVLDEWPVANGGGRGFTTVASWRGPYGPVELDGTVFGLRVHEFRKYLELPARSGGRFELALDIHAAETRDLDALAAHGWALTDPRAAAGDPWRYRDYVRRSAAELMVAKGMYVEARSGWFSDRSICYLASGRPVLAQDTGFRYPSGEGLLAFSTLDEAVAGVQAIVAEPARHRRAARELAEAYFRSDLVLGRLLERLGVA